MIIESAFLEAFRLLIVIEHIIEFLQVKTTGGLDFVLYLSLYIPVTRNKIEL